MCHIEPHFCKLTENAEAAPLSLNVSRRLRSCKRLQSLLGAHVFVLRPTNEALSAIEGMEGEGYFTE